MPPKVQKSKAAKALAATSSAKGKGKKKWSKGKMREKKNHLVVFNKAVHDKICKEVPKKMKVITVYSLVENYKINGSLARSIMRTLGDKGAIKCINRSAKMPTEDVAKNANVPRGKGLHDPVLRGCGRLVIS